MPVNWEQLKRSVKEVALRIGGHESGYLTKICLREVTFQVSVRVGAAFDFKAKIKRELAAVDALVNWIS